MAIVIQQLENIINIINDAKPAGQQVIDTVPLNTVVRIDRNQPDYDDVIIFDTVEGIKGTSVKFDGNVYVWPLNGAKTLFAGNIDDLVNTLNNDYFVTNVNLSPESANILPIDAGDSISVAQKTILGNYVQDFNNISAVLNRKGTGTQNYGQGVSGMNVLAGEYAVCQSYQVHPYFAGKSQNIEITFDKMHHQEGVVKKVGYFDSDRTAPYNAGYDGFYLESDGSVYNLVIANKNTGEIKIPQSSWDNQGISLDLSKFSIMKIDFLYLGGSSVRFYFKTDKGFELAHTYNHANNVVGTIVDTPSLPVRWEIRSTTGTGALGQICAAVSTSGAISIIGQQLSTPVITSPVNANASGTAYLLAAVRLKDKKKALLNLRVTAMAIGNDNLNVSILLNPTINGAPVWTEFTDDTGQLLGVEYAKGDTVGNPSATTCEGGLQIWTTPLSQAGRNIDSGGVALNRKIGIDLDGVAEVAALVAIPLDSGTNADAYGDITLSIN